MKKQPFEETFKRRKKIQARINGILREISLIGPLQSLAAASGEEYSRIKSFIQQNGGSEADLPANKIGTLNLYKERHEAASSKYKAAKEKNESLRAELAELEKDLSGLSCDCSQKELLEIQEAAAAAQAETVKIKQAIADQKKLIAQAAAGIPSIQHLLQRREDLLAQKAIGKQVDGDLATIEEQIERESKVVEEAESKAKSVASIANQTIVGLTRSLENIEKEAARLSEKILPNAFSGYLLSRAELVGAEYLRAAQELFGKYNQLIALGRLLKETAPAGPENPGWDMYRNIEVPIFPIKACKDVDWKLDVPGLDEMMEAERHVLREQGVHLDTATL